MPGTRPTRRHIGDTQFPVADRDCVFMRPRVLFMSVTDSRRGLVPTVTAVRGSALSRR